MEGKYVNESRAVKSAFVMPQDSNAHGTMFGGKLMSYIDDIAAISATRHARTGVVTASTDSVDFLHPIKVGDSVCLESFVSWTHRSSMEIFVKVITEDLMTSKRQIATTSFLTFVALGEDGRPTEVPPVIPQTEEEILLHESGPERHEVRLQRKANSQKFAGVFTVKKPWE